MKKTLALNRRAKKDYEIIKTYKAGLVLVGSEVKSCKEGNAKIVGSYVVLKNSEAFLIGSYIAPYKPAGERNHDPERSRKLLLNKNEISRLKKALDEKGISIVPLELFIEFNKIKLLIAIGKGLKKIDKRQKIKERDQKRKLERRFKS